MCETAVCENHQASRLEQWETEREDRLDRACSPVLPTDDVLHAGALAELRRRNALQPIPCPECIKCGWPVDERDMDDLLFRKHCFTCGLNRLEDLLRRIVRRKGRKATIKALKRLARRGK